MRIAIVNKYHFVSGGPERYLFGVKRLLEQHGHTVAPLALRLDRNLPSPWSRYFLPPPAGEGASHYRDFRLGPLGRLRLLGRAIYDLDARRRMADFVRREKMDVVYLLNICNYISPSVVDGARQAGARVVMRMSDYHFACAAYHFLRQGRVCCDCLAAGPWLGARRRCLRGSAALSLARAVTMAAHRLLGVYRRVDAFVAPSRFMAKALVQWGAPASRVHYLPSFAEVEGFEPRFEPGGYAVFFGRLSGEKGVEALLRAWARMGAEAPALRIAGEGEARPELERLAAELRLTNVTFEGFVEGEALRRLVAGAAFSVVPSIWADNSPMSVYESMALGKPVIATRLGGMSDQVVHGETGFLVPPADDGALANAALRLWRDKALCERMGRAGRRRVETVFGPEAHLRGLMGIIES